MSFFKDYVEPRVIDCVCGGGRISAQRKKIVPFAAGRVLEIGFGTGLNLPFYDPKKVEHLWALEPSPAMRKRSVRRVEGIAFPIEPLDLPGEQIPLDDHSVDTVLVTYTLCTIPGVVHAIEGMRRVLKPGGTLLFCEHGRAPDPGVARWQDRLDGVWGRFSGGCHINRDVRSLLEHGGFDVTGAQTAYLTRTPRVIGFHCWGSARPV